MRSSKTILPLLAHSPRREERPGSLRSSSSTSLSASAAASAVALRSKALPRSRPLPGAFWQKPLRRCCRRRRCRCCKNGRSKAALVSTAAQGPDTWEADNRGHGAGSAAAGDQPSAAAPARALPARPPAPPRQLLLLPAVAPARDAGAMKRRPPSGSITTARGAHPCLARLARWLCPAPPRAGKLHACFTVPTPTGYHEADVWAGRGLLIRP